MFSLPSDKYDVTLTDTHIAIRAKILTDVSALLTWSPQNLSPVLSKEMETNAYHPFAQCSHPQSMVPRFHLPRFYRRALKLTELPAKCFTTAHTTCVLAWTQIIFVLIEKKHTTWTSLTNRRSFHIEPSAYVTKCPPTSSRRLKKHIGKGHGS